MRFMISFAVAAMLASAAHAEGPGEVPGLGPFTAVELQGDGRVEIRPGKTQSVTLVAGDRWQDSFKVDPKGRLVITGCKGCGEGFRVTVVMPEIEALSAVAGGALVVDKGFPKQAAAVLSVTGGGEIDARNISADTVIATVTGVGEISTAPTIRLVAQITGGGEITYIGAPRITSSIVGGGTIERAAN